MKLCVAEAGHPDFLVACLLRMVLLHTLGTKKTKIIENHLFVSLKTKLVEPAPVKAGAGSSPGAGLKPAPALKIFRIHMVRPYCAWILRMDIAHGYCAWILRMDIAHVYACCAKHKLHDKIFCAKHTAQYTVYCAKRVAQTHRFKTYKPRLIKNIYDQACGLAISLFQQESAFFKVFWTQSVLWLQ